MPSDFNHQVTFSVSFQEKLAGSPHSPREGLGLGAISLPERIKAAVVALNHSQGYSGASLPQFPPLVWPFPTSIPLPDGLLVGNPSGYQVGGVGPYRILAPVKSGLALTAAWRVLAMVLLRIATDELSTFEAGLCNSRVVEVDIPIDLAFNLAASHHQSRIAWRASNPLEVNAFPKLVGERQTCRDPIDLDLFSAVMCPSQPTSKFRPSASNSFRFQVKPNGLAYAYALRLTILDRIAPSQGDSKEALSLFFAWWRTLDSWESRFASHLLLSSGRPNAWGKSPTYDYLDSTLGQVLGKKGGPAHARRAMNVPRVVGARFLASVERMHDALMNLRSHYQRAMGGLGLPKVSTPPMRPISAPSLFIHPSTPGDVRIQKDPCKGNQTAATVPKVQSPSTVEEIVRPSGEPFSRPDGDPSRPSGILERPSGEEMVLEVNEHKGIGHVIGSTTFKQASKQETDGMQEPASACLPAQEAVLEPAFIEFLILWDEYYKTRLDPSCVQIGRRGEDGMLYVVESVPNPVLFADPKSWWNGRYDPYRSTGMMVGDIPMGFIYAEGEVEDHSQQLSTLMNPDDHSSRHLKDCVHHETSELDGLTVEQAKCIKSLQDSFGHEIWRVRDLLSIAYKTRHGRCRTDRQRSIAVKKYKHYTSKVIELIKDIDPLPLPGGVVVNAWTEIGLEQLNFLLKGCSNYPR